MDFFIVISTSVISRWTLALNRKKNLFQWLKQKYVAYPFQWGAANN